jgi:hypothetical protein
MSIPVKEAANKAFLSSHSPMIRWLQEIVSRQIKIQVANVGASPFVSLESLHNFCTSSDDLVRAFVLSSLCREVVSVVTKKKEAKTFGKISRKECGEYISCLASYLPAKQKLINHFVPFSPTMGIIASKTSSVSPCITATAWNESWHISHHSGKCRKQ